MFPPQTVGFPWMSSRTNAGTGFCCANHFLTFVIYNFLLRFPEVVVVIYLSDLIVTASFVYRANRCNSRQRNLQNNRQNVIEEATY